MVAEEIIIIVGFLILVIFLILKVVDITNKIESMEHRLKELGKLMMNSIVKSNKENL